MTISARVIADSIHHHGPRPSRLTTFELRYPRFIHAEFMTHRMFSRNSASSRAIPIEKMIRDVLDDPAVFVFWGRNQKGMQAIDEMTTGETARARDEWLSARDAAVHHARLLLQMGLHKQNVNRLLEPWMHITVIASATDFANFYNLRCHSAAQPEMRVLAEMMRDAHTDSVPVDRTHLQDAEEWHLPLVTDSERVELGADAIKVSVGRCARVSYLTHDGVRDPAADIELHDRLCASGHWSPTEHVARISELTYHSGNFYGWMQYRKTRTNEHPYQPGQVLP
jgi:thymidylate synthase ThyX